MSDLIERQQAIDELIKMLSDCFYADEEVLDAVETTLKELPSAQPTFDARDTQYNLPIGTDLISRQAAIKATWQDTGYTDPFNMMTAIRDRIEQLPSAQPKLLQPWEVLVAQAVLPQPKMGKWILDRSGAYCCSECMEPCAGYVMMKPRDKFCKMCGSRNVVTE